MRWVLIVLLLLPPILSGCTLAREPWQSPVSPIPTPEQTNRIYFPVAAAQYLVVTPRKLGLTGATCEQLQGIRAVYTHDWSLDPPGCVGIASIATVWGGRSTGSVPGEVNILAGYNEPDREDQANLYPEEAAWLWPEIEALAEQENIEILLSPAPSHQDLDWLVQFREAYYRQNKRWPRLNGIAVHCYLPTAEGCWERVVRPALTWADKWGATAGVWVTEFAFMPGVERSWGQTWAEVQEFACLCESNPGVAAYLWYKAQPGKVAGTFDGVSWAPAYEYDGQEWQRTWIGNQLRVFDPGECDNRQGK